MPLSDSASRTIDPECLGPLGDRPLRESAPASSADDLFPGAQAFLRPRQHERRRGQWGQVRQMVDRVLEPGERVLYVAQAMQNPPVLHVLTMGYLAKAYHQVLLVLTDRKLVEILLDLRGKTPQSRIRAFPWQHARGVRLRFRSLKLTPGRGRKQTWTMPIAGDRALLKRLVPRLTDRCMPEGAGAAVEIPFFHCPNCGAQVVARPAGCGSCKALFRSPRLAAWLSLAFPGAGLLYAGHPVLATADFLGEVLLFTVAALGLAHAVGPQERAGALFVGLFLLAMTKIESVHIGHLLATRNRPESAERFLGFKRFAVGGAMASLLAVGGALFATGRLVPVVDHDLGFAVAGSAWSGGRDAGDWEYFADDPATRSQWTHENGMVVTVFAYPLDGAAAAGAFRAQFHEAMGRSGGRLLLEDEQIPGPFSGFRYVAESTGEGGDPIAAINYFLYDGAGTDVHQVFTAVPAGFRADAEELIESLLARAEWTDAVPPGR